MAFRKSSTSVAFRESGCSVAYRKSSCRRTSWLSSNELFCVERSFDIDGHIVKSLICKNISLVLEIAIYKTQTHVGRDCPFV